MHDVIPAGHGAGFFRLMQAVGSNGPRLSTWPQLSEPLFALDVLFFSPVEEIHWGFYCIWCGGVDVRVF